MSLILRSLHSSSIKDQSNWAILRPQFSPSTSATQNYHLQIRTTNNKMALKKATANDATLTQAEKAANQQFIVDSRQIIPVESSGSGTEAVVHTDSKNNFIEKAAPIFTAFSLPSNIQLQDGLGVIRSLGNSQREVLHIDKPTRDVWAAEQAGLELKKVSERDILISRVKNECEGIKENCTLAVRIASTHNHTFGLHGTFVLIFSQPAMSFLFKSFP